MDTLDSRLVLNHSLTMNPQDLPRPPTEEHADNLCNVALHLHIHRSLHCLSLPLQLVCAGPIAVLADDTPLQLLRRLSHSRKFELGIQLCWILSVCLPPTESRKKMFQKFHGLTTMPSPDSQK